MNKCYASKNDYDFYKILLPVSVLNPIKQKKYIYQELGKLHPCFGEDFAFDSKVGITKKGLQASVVVLNKMKLNKYKNGLFVYENAYKKYFTNGKRNDWLLFCLMIVIFIVLVFSMIRIKTAVPVESVVETKNAVSEIKTDLELVHLQIESCEFLNKLTEIGAAEKIIGIEWERHFENEKLKVEFEGIFPESVKQFENEGFCPINFSKITYKEHVPFFNIIWQKKRVYENFQIEKLNPEQNWNKINQAKKEIRKLLIDNQCFIREEVVFPYKLSFIMPIEKINVLKNFQYLVQKNNLEISYIKLNFQEAGNYFVIIELQQNEDEVKNDFFYSLCKNIGLLKKENNGAKTERKSQSENENHNLVQNSKNKLVKIGTVTNPQGEKLSFYKNEFGKIEVRSSYE